MMRTLASYVSAFHDAALVVGAMYFIYLGAVIAAAAFNVEIPQ